MVGKVVLRMSGCSVGANVARNCDDGEHENDKAKSRDGKEDIHACLEKNTRCAGFLQLIRSSGDIDWIFREGPTFYMAGPLVVRGVLSVRFARGGGMN